MKFEEMKLSKDFAQILLSNFKITFIFEVLKLMKRKNSMSKMMQFSELISLSQFKMTQSKDHGAYSQTLQDANQSLEAFYGQDTSHITN